MKARYLKNALETVPDDADIVCLDEELGEVGVEKFKYYENQRCVALILEPPLPDEEEDVDDDDYEIEEETAELSPNYEAPETFTDRDQKFGKHGNLIIDGEYTVVEPDAGPAPAKGKKLLT